MDSRHSYFSPPLLATTDLYSTRNFILMARIYPLLCFSIAILHSLVSAHMIEVPAGSKDCYFEDLHTNDKVCMEFMIALLDDLTCP